MEMHEKIKTLRKKHNLTLEDVGNVVGVGKSTVRKWENGDIANMRRDKIAKLAEALHTTPAYLMGWSENETEEYNPKQPSSDIFALRIKGHSMEPRIFDGDTVIVKRQNDVQSGEIAVIEVDGKTTTKKVIKQENGLLVVGLNAAAYTPKFFDYKDIKIIGKVIEIRGNVDGWNK